MALSAPQNGLKYSQIVFFCLLYLQDYKKISDLGIQKKALSQWSSIHKHRQYNKRRLCLANKSVAANVRRALSNLENDFT